MISTERKTNFDLFMVNLWQHWNKIEKSWPVLFNFESVSILAIGSQSHSLKAEKLRDIGRVILNKTEKLFLFFPCYPNVSLG